MPNKTIVLTKDQWNIVTKALGAYYDITQPGKKEKKSDKLIDVIDAIDAALRNDAPTTNLDKGTKAKNVKKRRDS